MYKRFKYTQLKNQVRVVSVPKDLGTTIINEINHLCENVELRNKKFEQIDNKTTTLNFMK